MVLTVTPKSFLVPNLQPLSSSPLRLQVLVHSPQVNNNLVSPPYRLVCIFSELCRHGPNSIYSSFLSVSFFTVAILIFIYVLNMLIVNPFYCSLENRDREREGKKNN